MSTRHQRDINGMVVAVRVACSCVSYLCGWTIGSTQWRFRYGTTLNFLAVNVTSFTIFILKWSWEPLIQICHFGHHLIGAVFPTFSSHDCQSKTFWPVQFATQPAHWACDRIRAPVCHCHCGPLWTVFALTTPQPTQPWGSIPSGLAVTSTNYMNKMNKWIKTKRNPRPA